MGIVYKNTITADEVNIIRKSMGWRQILIEQLQAGLDGSTLVVAAYEENEAIGMACLSWNGGYSAIISDVLIIPEYRNKGIENELITNILDFLRSKLKSGFGIQVDIRAWNDDEVLFESLGFQISKKEQRGLPMHICLTNQIELTDAKFKQMEFGEKATVK